MSNENEGKATGGSRMKALQEGTSLQGEHAGVQQTTAAPAAQKSRSASKAPPRNAGKTPEIDYEKLATMVAGKLAPVMRTGGVSTEAMEVGQMPDIMLPDGTLATGGIDIADIDKPLNSGYFTELAFMEEEIQIVVHETEDQNAENPVIVGNNGIFKVFHRGVPTVAKRKFVDGLIVKSTRVSTPEILNPAGERTNVIKQHSAHKYSFNVIQDRNPKGTEWLRRRMAEIV